MARAPLPEGLDHEDWQISATIRHLHRLDSVLDRLGIEADGQRFATVIDFGCGLGGLTQYVSRQFGIDHMYGVDVDEERLERARSRGLTTFNIDLAREPIPLRDDSIDLVLSFGAFEHIAWYDNVLAETARLLKHGGWLLLSMPNLGSYVNRAALLFGFQPREVEVSRKAATGMLPFYRSQDSHGEPIGHIHSATLRCMTGLLEHFGLEPVVIQGFSPDFGRRSLKVLDAVFGRVPSLARRYIILARRSH
jgi:SAM-dependent methyltransferase